MPAASSRPDLTVLTPACRGAAEAVALKTSGLTGIASPVQRQWVRRWTNRLALGGPVCSSRPAEGALAERAAGYTGVSPKSNRQIQAAGRARAGDRCPVRRHQVGASAGGLASARFFLRN